MTRYLCLAHGNSKLTAIPLTSVGIKISLFEKCLIPDELFLPFKHLTSEYAV